MITTKSDFRHFLASFDQTTIDTLYSQIRRCAFRGDYKLAAIEVLNNACRGMISPKITLGSVEAIATMIRDRTTLDRHN